MERKELIFEIPYEDFASMSWEDVARAIEKKLLTHGGDIIINGYTTVDDSVFVYYSLLIKLERKIYGTTN